MLTDASQFLLFEIADRRLLLASPAVREVVRAVWVQPVPDAPDGVRGLIDYRGTPIAVVDFRPRLGLPTRPLHPNDQMIVARTETGCVALVVDRVEGLTAPPRAHAWDPPEAPVPEVVAGIFRTDDGLLLVHAPDRLADLGGGSRGFAPLRAPADPEDQVGADPDDGARAVLLGRARELSRVVTADERLTGPSAVTFTIGADRFAIGLRWVLEVTACPPVTAIPGVPDFVVGVVAFRGEVLMVAELPPLLGRSAERPGLRARLLVLGRDRPELGILADHTQEVISLSAEGLRRAEPEDPRAPDFAVGVTEDGLRALDGGALLDDPRLFVHRARDADR